MKALNTLRNLIFFFAFVRATTSASATDGAKRTRKVSARTGTEQAIKPQRKEVAAFVDPTAPLAELVERVRTEQAQQN
jgi:hypothetical protein